MPNRLIPYVKVLVHLVLLVPFFGLVWQYRSGALANDADPVAFLTHATGNWALWILLASLAITPLRRLHPKLANLIRFRRLVGLYAFFYASLHLLIYLFLFSGYDLGAAFTAARAGHVGEIWTQWKLVWPTVWDDFTKRRFVQIGFFSWVILLALAVTSPTVMLRKMGGKNWQRLHRLVYLGAVGACLHYWWLVKTGVKAPLPDTVVLTVLLLARLVWSGLKRRKAAVGLSGRASGAKVA